MRLTIVLTTVFLSITAAILGATVPRMWLIARDESRAARDGVADALVTALESVDLEDASAVAAVVKRFESLRSIYAIDIDHEPIMAAADPAMRRVRRAGRHTVVITFKEAGRLPGALRAALVAATAGTIAALIFSAVALFELFAFVRSSRLRSTHAGKDGLLETMQSSIHVMKGREEQLRQLHETTKERAGELSAITATLVRSITSGFIAIDQTGRIVDMNQAARDILHYEGPALGITPRDAFERDAFKARMQEAVDGRLALQRVEVDEADGTVIGLTTVPLRDDAGRHFGMLALFADLTPARDIENRLRQMQSLADLGEMSAGIAHEFRNSLSVVLGYLRLARKAGPPAPVDETIARAENEARELSVAVDSLLTFTRPMELQLHPLELSEFVESIASRLRVLDERVAVTVETTPVTVTADAALLSRVVENLIRNAFDAVREKVSDAHIDIRVTREPPTITVTDNGVGLEAGQAARLFVPFQSTKPSGFGLGLAMARKIVLFHGGVITLENGPAGGAVATVRLPSSDAARDSAPPWTPSGR